MTKCTGNILPFSTTACAGKDAQIKAIWVEALKAKVWFHYAPYCRELCRFTLLGWYTLTRTVQVAAGEPP